MTPEEAAARIAALKKILTQRLDNKSAANESNAICLRKSLLFSASAKSGVLSRQQFAHAFERLGAGFSPAVRAGGRARRAVRPASLQRALTPAPLPRPAASRTSSCSSARLQRRGAPTGTRSTSTCRPSSRR